MRSPLVDQKGGVSRDKRGPPGPLFFFVGWSSDRPEAWRSPEAAAAKKKKFACRGSIEGSEPALKVSRWGFVVLFFFLFAAGGGGGKK